MNNLPLINIEKFKLVESFDMDWKVLMNKKIIECITNVKYSDADFYNYPVQMKHGVTHINNNTFRALEGIKISWIGNPHLLNKKEMLINVISE